MKKNYKIKKTISMKQFISEFGEDFSEHMKDRLLELNLPCVLTRKEDINKLEIKHVEHIMHNSTASNKREKEFIYGTFVVMETGLYFSEKSTENDTAMPSPIVASIFNSLNNENMISDEESNMKKVDDSNIDYVVDSIFTVCPPVSQKHLEIVRQMTMLSTK